MKNIPIMWRFFTHMTGLGSGALASRAGGWPRFGSRRGTARAAPPDPVGWAVGTHSVCRRAQPTVVERGHASVAVPSRSGISRALAVALGRGIVDFVALEHQPMQVKQLRVEEHKHQIAYMGWREVLGQHAVQPHRKAAVVVVHGCEALGPTQCCCFLLGRVH